MQYRVTQTPYAGQAARLHYAIEAVVRHTIDCLGE
jgi:hypothetical protein